MTVTEASLFLKREALRQFFNQGIKPVDGRQPIPEEIAQDMVQELVEFDVPKDALIGVVDSFMILTLVLQEHGFTNIVLLENTYTNLTPLHETYYNTIKGACEKIGVKYYVPPMNNYSRCDMKFDVVIGNPPYQSPNSGGSLRGSSNSALWWKISKQSLGLLKSNGLISYVTPSTIVSGGDGFTTLFLGANRKYDLKKVDFSANDYFNVGIPICRWVAVNSLTENNIINIDKKTLNEENIINAYKKYLIIISAFIPYIANECWEKITKENNLSSQEWPKIEKTLVKKDHFDVVIQINGKKRAIINAISNESEENIFSKSLAIKNIKVILEEKTIIKKIFIKNN